MLEISLVVRSGGQERDERPLTIRGRDGCQLSLQRPKEIRQSLHAERTEDVFVQGRNDEPILKRVTGARRALGPIINYPPATIGGAGEITGVNLQVSGAGDRNAAARPDIIILTLNDHRYDQSFPQQAPTPL